MQCQAIPPPYLQQTGLILEGECKLFSPTIWNLSLFMTFWSSKWNILYQSCYCGLFMCSFQFKISTLIRAEGTSNKKSCDTEYFTWKSQNVNEWMKPWKCERCCFLSQNIPVFKMCSSFSLLFITFTALWCVMVCTNVFCKMYRSWWN